jgi:hypothetical protein
MGLSTLCLIHCLGLPLLAAFAPALGLLAEAEWVHWSLIAAAGPISLVAFAGPALRGAPYRLGIALALLGLAQLTGALFAPHAQETLLSVTGGITLASAHLLNWRRSAHRH